jgi:hypothetical protein
LRDVGILYSQAVTQRTTIVSAAFLEHGLADKITVCAHTNRDPNKQEDQIQAFLYLAAQNFELFSNIKN